MMRFDPTTVTGPETPVQPSPGVWQQLWLRLRKVTPNALVRFLPLASIRWREVWPGAALTAVLFWLGGYGVGLYLLFSPISSAYGAASALSVFLIWVFISTSIVLYGAKFTQLYASLRGRPIEPKEGVVLTPAPPEPEWLALLK